VLPDDDNSTDAADDAATTDDTTDDTDDTDDAAKVDVPDAKATGAKADGKVQDSPKLPPTHTEN
jgi:preprotein translocase subunit YajC